MMEVVFFSEICIPVLICCYFLFQIFIFIWYVLACNLAHDIFPASLFVCLFTLVAVTFGRLHTSVFSHVRSPKATKNDVIAI